MAKNKINLEDVDKMSLKQMDGGKRGIPEIKQERVSVCPICTSVHNIIVTPRTEMDGMVLRKCKTCGERFYD